MSLFPELDFPEQAARLAPRLKTLASEGLYFGTSSWKYPGWLGSIYGEDSYRTRGKFSQKKFDENCLGEYSRVFPTVCGDFAFYQFPTRDYWDRLFPQTPADFRFGLKVPEEITVAQWPRHARYGVRAGEPNSHFLDAEIFERHFTNALEPHRAKVGPLIFEFGTFNKSTFPKLDDFLQRLDPFLAALPDGFRYAVEIRNSEYLSPEYLDLLKSRRVAHVFNAWTRMPTLDEQIQLPDAFTADFTVVRALLKKGRAYEDAVKSFEPYQKIQEPNEGARAGMIEIARAARKRKIPAFLFVNNRLEGHAPGTIEAVVESL
jgi:uncharacterized protein YecE (DUF72 family)